MHNDTNSKQQPIRLIQITDSHLGKQAGDTLMGMDCDASLGHILDLIASEHDKADVLLATGDISSCGTLSSYERFKTLTDDVASQALWLPGNHDDLPTMQALIAGGSELTRSYTLGNWQIIMLNSTINGVSGGCISDDELNFLRRALEQCEGRFALVCLHHHPIHIGCDWLDGQQVNNSDEFFALLDQFDHVRGVLWGHIHQSINRIRKGVRLMATPSSCIQFAPASPEFKLSKLSPGYRWLELDSNGSITTEVSRVKNVVFDIDYNNTSNYDS